MPLEQITLDDLEAMKNRATGLVPMQTTRAFAPYKKGAKAGFSPKDALMHLQNGDATLLDESMQERVAATVKKSSAAVQMPKAARQGEGGGEGPVEIPENWETEGPLKRIALAKRIAGGEFKVPDGKKPNEYANEVIKAEIEKRSAPAA